jgi:glycosyltransferase involved in cell wall biosynthesis
MFHDWTAPRLNKWANHYVAVSGATRDAWVESGLDADRVDVVHQGIDPALYPAGDEGDRARARDKLGLPLDGFVALYFGRLDKDKGIDVLLDAWRRLRIPLDKGRLVLKGRPVLAQDPDAVMRELQTNAPPGCEWLPMDADVLTALHAADVVVLASTTEGLGRSVLEGMATGRPVVATRVGGVPEILSGPFDRFLFEAGDSAALADRLCDVAPWRTREPQLGPDCAAHIHANFSLDTMADRIEGILEDQITAGRRRRVGEGRAVRVPSGQF